MVSTRSRYKNPSPLMALDGGSKAVIQPPTHIIALTTGKRTDSELSTLSRSSESVDISSTHAQPSSLPLSQSTSTATPSERKNKTNREIGNKRKWSWPCLPKSPPPNTKSRAHKRRKIESFYLPATVYEPPIHKQPETVDIAEESKKSSGKEKLAQPGFPSTLRDLFLTSSPEPSKSANRAGMIETSYRQTAPSLPRADPSTNLSKRIDAHNAFLEGELPRVLSPIHIPRLYPPKLDLSDDKYNSEISLDQGGITELFEMQDRMEDLHLAPVRYGTGFPRITTLPSLYTLFERPFRAGLEAKMATARNVTQGCFVTHGPGYYTSRRVEQKAQLRAHFAPLYPENGRDAWTDAAWHLCRRNGPTLSRAQRHEQLYTNFRWRRVREDMESNESKYRPSYTIIRGSP